MENSEVNDYLDTLDETVEGTVDESVGSLLGEESGLFVEEVVMLMFLKMCNAAYMKLWLT